MHCEKPQNPVPFPCAPCEIKLSQAEIFLETQKCSKNILLRKFWIVKSHQQQMIPQMWKVVPLWSTN